MATWPAPQLNERELEALRKALIDAPFAVYFPATGRIFRCPNLHAPEHGCDREATFSLDEAELLAARIRAGELGPIPAGLGPVVLAYGIPWTRPRT